MATKIQRLIGFVLLIALVGVGVFKYEPVLDALDDMLRRGGAGHAIFIWLAFMTGYFIYKFLEMFKHE